MSRDCTWRKTAPAQSCRLSSARVPNRCQLRLLSVASRQSRARMCAREKQVRSIIPLAPRALGPRGRELNFHGSRRRRVRLPMAAHSAGTLAQPPRATASPMPRQGPGRRTLGAGPCRGHGRRRRLGGAGPTYSESLSRTCRPDRLGAPAAGLHSGLRSHAGGITYKSESA